MRKTLIGLLLLLTSCNSDAFKYTSTSNNEGNSLQLGAFDNQIAVNQQDGGAGLFSSKYTPCEASDWKPESEKTGALAIISAKFDPRPDWQGVTVCSAEADAALVVSADSFCESGQEESCSPSGARSPEQQQVWRCSKPGAAYNGEYLIEYEGKKCIRRVPDPSKRSNGVQPFIQQDQTVVQ